MVPYDGPGVRQDVPVLSRNVTNVIRWFLDECLPPIIRDRKWLLYPLFHLAYRGKDVDRYMEFKRDAYDLTEEEFAQAYEDMDSIGTERPTDMNRESVARALAEFAPDSTASVLDVGCGRGWFVDTLTRERPGLRVTGLDVLEHVPLEGADYVRGSAERLPFDDDSFDVVFTSHTIEHVRDLPAMVRELLRVARHSVIVVTPRQRAYRYTFDMHLNFFWFDYELPRLFGLASYDQELLRGDWVYVGRLSAD